MLVALILVSIGFAVTLGMLLFGSNRASVPTPTVKGELDDASKARARAESELERKQKELDEQRSQLQEVKEQLKQTKRKLFEQKESEKGERDLLKARAETERQASVQLEMVRVELANALAEVERLRGEQGGGARQRRAPAPQPAAPSAPAASSAPAAPTAEASAPATGQISAPAQEGERVVMAAVQVTPAAEQPAAEKDRGQRRYRELNDADREKMERLEHTANKERSRAGELERELRRVKGQSETQQRIFAAAKSELDLQKDKYRALEKRMNRALLERDLLRRAIRDLEKKTGMMADRTELTPDEMAASDQRTDEVARERAAAEAQRAAAQAQPEAAKPAESTEAPAASSEATTAAAEADKSASPGA
ncbi:coiled-coil domain-containing protein [Hyalangium gracile]|uniref:cell envelope biogenesis protein TolA n=1 Tax=Hyalangium gracile TaxID=394092 RepID=UPI001CCFC722|nr:cell envelope biogenesis protein TolA [Hyalangium gracile]